MKKINIYYILALLFAISFIACEDTNENLVKERGAAVVPKVSNISPAFYTTDFENSYIMFDVDIPEGQVVEDAEIQATFKGKTVVLEKIESFPMKQVKITAPYVMNKLGLSESDVKLDDSFVIDIVTYSGGVPTRSYTGAIKAMVTCVYDPALAVGNYKVVSADWEVQGNVTLTADPEDPYKISVAGLYAMEGGEANDNVLVLNIDPDSYSVTGDKAKLGPTAPWGAYTNYYYQPVGGLYKSCEGAFELQIAISVDAGGFGTFKFVFTPIDPS